MDIIKLNLSEKTATAETLPIAGLVFACSGDKIPRLVVRGNKDAFIVINLITMTQVNILIKDTYLENDCYRDVKVLGKLEI